MSHKDESAEDIYGDYNKPATNRPPRLQHDFFWIWANYQGRKVVLGPYNDKDEAQEKGSKLINGYFDVVELHTRDLSKATQILKARSLGESHDLGFALRKVRHQIK